jgi:hypothetical protein
MCRIRANKSIQSCFALLHPGCACPTYRPPFGSCARVHALCLCAASPWVRMPNVPAAFWELCSCPRPLSLRCFTLGAHAQRTGRISGAVLMSTPFAFALVFSECACLVNGSLVANCALVYSLGIYACVNNVVSFVNK